ncbi:hypothetical protein O3G_MSEX004840 [Manduca sexta]|uniref:Angiotensin-converting enzyme n=1 Tax=Manduca sexta TaxID=7130 RepID=A0A921YXR9_MANSE|nr:hypothetical protein O3G_MSEX004840 [Manduca sexta]KAG6447267.1 hypothetical protein O3G_MSEX004840 [Manduca sexta]KAG6447268.1 hypothetical protein O3G_MSEX004840 [Manduca sexta]KAG6447269.1 hypothetical protein O3G_MSEX004840 [Manduca sexta]KAG6447270.1 hypothetical protein O3G_MSEX004840 [Manduca sexta]
MKTLHLILILFTFKTYLCSDINELFETINKDYDELNAIGANIAWDSSVDPDNPELETRSEKYQRNLLAWQRRTCDRLAALDKSQLLNNTQRRQMYLLCKGPKFTNKEARLLSNLYDELQSIYSKAEVCIATENYISEINSTVIEDAILNYLTYIKEVYHMVDKDYVFVAAQIAAKQKWRKRNTICLKGEDDFQNMMVYSRNEEVLRWLWLVWREMVGPTMKLPYRQLVDVENRAARRNGYSNIGVSWREDLEIPNLRQLCRKLYNDILPLYKTLHGIVRYFLRKHYGNDVPEKGPIPAHLLGNMWAENWDSLLDLILKDSINLDERIKQSNWTVMHMVKRAEDFYQSLSLPAMTGSFWRESILERETDRNIRCHGAAADMFQDGDFRILFCGRVSMENFYVLHHELGHIQYYMAYEQQPAIFRQANKALHEAIGDTIMYGVLTPQHLHRLGLINDTTLYATNNNIELIELDNKKFDDLTETRFNTEQHKIRKRNGDMSDEIDPNNNNLELKIDENSIQIRTNDRELRIYHPEGIISSSNKVKIDFDTQENTPGDECFGNDDITVVTNSYGSEDIIDSISENEEQNRDKETVIDLPSDKELDENKIQKMTLEDTLLLKQALNKIPQIAFSFLIDEYRWRYFEGSLETINKDFWDLALELQGIAPPGGRGEKYFDVGAKFHVPDNTPLMRYFLSSFLQHQLFETLCKAAVFGRRNADESIPPTITMNKCDIYGSKTVGKILKDLMSRGHSQHWSDILEAITGERNISSAPLERYYRPLFKLLKRIVHAHRIPIGWCNVK